MIPKNIHYVWLGKQPHNPLLKKCIESWKRYLPDYKIIEWNEENIASINNDYLNDAIANQQWAFASDVIRLYAVHLYGGFYFDTDLEVTRNLDAFLDLDLVLGFESYQNNYSIQTASFGAKPQSVVIKKILEHYNKPFFDTNGEFDLTLNPSIFENVLNKIYPNRLDRPYEISATMILDERVKIFPYYYFCKASNGQENYCIHHFSGSWKDTVSRKLKFKIANIKIIRIRSQSTHFPKSLAMKHLQMKEKIIFGCKFTKKIWYFVVWADSKSK